ncbi:uncharacterized protein RSE6_02832 [Rhynchosporium secalis]|uniref:Uncharacterized protein n=1 Tax=Rhynchosporium secalis TaxID=38038 RepID=A0A1E1M183_RHYSE|nr:uncharacterized protein RSE6_02832 [Rhynchosporium secalis]
MAPGEMVIFRVGPHGATRSEFIVSRRLLSTISYFKVYFDNLSFEKQREGESIELCMWDPELEDSSYFMWEPFFVWLHRGFFEVPNLPEITQEIIAHDQPTIHHEELECMILLSLLIAQGDGLFDLQNMVMDALYDVGRLTKKYLGPAYMRHVLKSSDVDSKFQTYCAISIAFIFKDYNYQFWDVDVFADYEDLVHEIPELATEVSYYEAIIAHLDDRIKDTTSQIHKYYGPCEFHEHPNNAKCYSEQGFRPFGDVDSDSEAGIVVGMEDEATETDRTESESLAYDVYLEDDEWQPSIEVRKESHKTQKFYSEPYTLDDEIMYDADFEDSEEGEAEFMNEESKDEKDMDTATTAGNVCACTEDEKKYMLHPIRCAVYISRKRTKEEEEGEEEGDLPSIEETDAEDDDMAPPARKRHKVCACTEEEEKHMLHSTGC